eukprot:XP_001696596.1 predicted protein [Chlamydomonas reinhardtii]
MSASASAPGAALAKLRTPAVLLAQNGNSLALPSYLPDEVETSRASIVATLTSTREAKRASYAGASAVGQTWYESDDEADDVDPASMPIDTVDVLHHRHSRTRPSPSGTMHPHPNPHLGGSGTGYVSALNGPASASVLAGRPASASPNRTYKSSSDMAAVVAGTSPLGHALAGSPGQTGVTGPRRPLSASATTQPADSRGRYQPTFGHSGGGAGARPAADAAAPFPAGASSLSGGGGGRATSAAARPQPPPGAVGSGAQSPHSPHSPHSPLSPPAGRSRSHVLVSPSGASPLANAAAESISPPAHGSGSGLGGLGGAAPGSRPPSGGR